MHISLHTCLNGFPDIRRYVSSEPASEEGSLTLQVVVLQSDGPSYGFKRLQGRQHEAGSVMPSPWFFSKDLDLRAFASLPYARGGNNDFGWACKNGKQFRWKATGTLELTRQSTTTAAVSSRKAQRHSVRYKQRVDLMRSIAQFYLDMQDCWS